MRRVSKLSINFALTLFMIMKDPCGACLLQCEHHDLIDLFEADEL